MSTISPAGDGRRVGHSGQNAKETVPAGLCGAPAHPRGFRSAANLTGVGFLTMMPSRRRRTGHGRSL